MRHKNPNEESQDQAKVDLRVREMRRAEEPNPVSKKVGNSLLSSGSPETKAGNSEGFTKRQDGGQINDQCDRQLKYLDPREAFKAAKSHKSGWGTLEPPVSEPWENAKACLASLEGAAEVYRWFKGPADLSRASPGDGHRIETTKVGDLLREDTAGVDVQRSRFRDFHYLADEGPRETCSRLWYLCHRWLKPERHTKEQILELVILEQFLAIMPSEVQNWVKAGRPQTCDQAVALAEDFAFRRRPRAGDPNQEGPGRSQETVLSFSIVQQPLLESADILRCSEVKQESDSEMDSKEDGWAIETRQEDIQAEKPELEKLRGRSWATPSCSQGDRREAPVGCNDGPEAQSQSRQDRKAMPPTGEDANSKQSVVVKRKRRSRGKKTCGVCGKTFSRCTVLAAHQRTHTGEKPFMCKDCGKCFSFKSTLVAHERTHTGERPYTCDQCGKSFTVSSVLTRHYRVHVEKEPFFCSDCDQSFPQKSQLLNHQKIHVKEKPFKCERCGESFSRSSSLKKHEASHTGEKPFKCPDCQKSFNTTSQLVKHYRVHTGERPYNCSECGKSFSQWQILMVHQRIHTGEKPFKCTTCGKCFSDRAVHIRHQKVHTGERPHECVTCGKRFTHRTVLVKHQKIHAREALNMLRLEEQLLPPSPKEAS